jgi:acetolactate synthase I/II/III large subunit
MIQQTQDQWLGSQYVASSYEGGLPDPDYLAIAKAYGISSMNLQRKGELDRGIGDLMNRPGPLFCNVEISANHRVIPQVKFGRPNEDPDPLLDRTEFLKNMVVTPLEVSLPPKVSLPPAA